MAARCLMQWESGYDSATPLEKCRIIVLLVTLTYKLTIINIIAEGPIALVFKSSEINNIHLKL